MSTPPCHTYPTKAKAIEGFCDEFPELCTVSNGVESVPSDVERTMLFDDNPNNDKNDCDGGFDFDLACPTACGTPQTTVSATYRVVADAFGGGKECPYHDGFVMERTCPAREPCSVDCEGSWSAWSGCPSCGTTSTSHSENRSWTTTSLLPPGYSYSPACPTQQKRDCPATPACTMPCAGDWGNWSGCPSCGTTSTSHSENRSWTTTSSLPPGYSYSPACPTQQKRDCPATPTCTVECEGSWGGWSACPTCGTTPSSHTHTRTWNTSSTLPSGYYYSPACPTTEARNCPATSKCVTPVGTPFILPPIYYEGNALGLGAMKNSWRMTIGHREVDIDPKKFYFYTFTSPELIYLQRFGYEVSNYSDLIPTLVAWYFINPDGSWTGPLEVSETTVTKSNNYSLGAFQAGKGYRGHKSKGLVLQIRSTGLNPNDSDKSDDRDYYLTFDVSGTYAGELSRWDYPQDIDPCADLRDRCRTYSGQHCYMWAACAKIRNVPGP